MTRFVTALVTITAAVGMFLTTTSSVEVTAETAPEVLATQDNPIEMSEESIGAGRTILWAFLPLLPRTERQWRAAWRRLRTRPRPTSSTTNGITAAPTPRSSR